MPTQCFYLKETNQVRRYLRRHHDDCPAPWTPFGGMAPLDVAEWPARTVLGIELSGVKIPHDDPRWPTQCACGRVFDAADHWQIFLDSVYCRADTGEEMSLRTAPPGAMWDAWWYGIHWQGADGRSLVVKVPPDGHEWVIDSRANNCTMPNDNAHRCWVRHGDPPNITVDKAGHTCAAGAGSIQTPKWHGFLRGGVLVEC